MMQFLDFKDVCVVALDEAEALRLEMSEEGGIVIADICKPLIPVLLLLLTHTRISHFCGTFRQMLVSLLSHHEGQLIQDIVVDVCQGLGNQILLIVVDHLPEGSYRISRVECHLVLFVLKQKLAVRFHVLQLLLLDLLFLHRRLFLLGAV